MNIEEINSIIETKIKNPLICSVDSNSGECRIHFEDGDSICLTSTNESCDKANFTYPFGELDNIIGKKIKSISKEEKNSEYFENEYFEDVDWCYFKNSSKCIGGYLYGDILDEDCCYSEDEYYENSLEEQKKLGIRKYKNDNVIRIKFHEGEDYIFFIQ